VNVILACKKIYLCFVVRH